MGLPRLAIEWCGSLVIAALIKRQKSVSVDVDVAVAVAVAVAAVVTAVIVKCT